MHAQVSSCERNRGGSRQRRRRRRSRLAGALVGLVALTVTAVVDRPAGHAQSHSSALHDTIADLDHSFFDAFNRRDLPTLTGFWAKDLEFYHDLGGLTHYRENIEAFGRTFSSERRVRRVLVENTLEVHPVKDFGAIEIGTHRFYATEPGQKEKLSSQARFVHLWQKRPEGWRLTRIISYDHRENLE